MKQNKTWACVILAIGILVTIFGGNYAFFVIPVICGTMLVFAD